MKNFTLKFVLMLLLGVGVVLPAAAQKIGGVVKDSSGNPVIGASVVIEGSTLGASSGIDGSWSLNVPDAAKKTLLVSYIGMKDQRFQIGSQTTFNITLEDEATSLDDVVVVGYATVKRRDVVGSVSSVNSETLTQMPVASVSEAMAGRMAGVSVTATEGNPDADIKIRVRGGGSITQDSSPLYIVDGFPVESISDIPASEISSIDILKDAFSTAIYGARGANGVVIVTTKSGSTGRVTVNYNVYYGFKDIANKNALRTLDPSEYVKFQYELASVRKRLDEDYAPYFGSFQDIDLYNGIQGNDWVEQVFGRTGSTFNHNLSISGGSDKAKWTAGYAHIDDKAIMLGSDYKRNNLNFKSQFKPKKNITFDVAVRYSDTDVRGSGANSISDAGTTSGNGRLKHAIGYTPIPTGTVVSGAEDEEDYGDNVQPLKSISDNDSKRKRTNWNANAAFTWEIIDDLSLKVDAGIDDYRQIDNRFYGLSTYYIYNQGLKNPSAQYSDYTRRKIRSTNTLNYDFKNVIGNRNHNLNLLLGQEYIVTRSNTLTAWVDGLPDFFSADQAWNFMGAGSNAKSTNNYYNPDDRLFSFFGRVNYDFKGKYSVSATMRADGSSKFSKGNQWGYFPSAAVAWRISDEWGMKDLTWLDNLKLRYSFGTAGNNNIPSGLIVQEFAGYNSDGWIDYGDNYWAVVKDADGKTVMSNPNLKWETTLSHNIGLDFSFFKGRLNGSVEVYQNNTRDLLIKFPTSGTGYDNQYRNLGETRNRGVEVAVTGVILEKKNYGLTASANISFNQNRVMSLGGLDQISASSYWASSEIGGDYLVKVGGSIGDMYGYVTEGRYEVSDFNYNDDSGKWTLKDGVVDDSKVIGAEYLRPGALKLADLNGDGLPDVTKIGSSQPLFTGGFALSGYAYGFDVSANFTFSYGNDIYNANKVEFTSSRKYKNRNLIDIMETGNRWTNIDWSNGQLYTDPDALAAANASTTMWSPAIGNAVFHSWAVEDGSYLRLSSLSVGYTFPQKWTRKIRLEKVRIYATGTNLFCWTSYTGYDPEVDTRRQTPLTPGVDYSAYPKSRSWVFGANITF